VKTHTPLSLLAEFGPLSRDTIARALDLPWVCVVEHVGKLKRQGLAVEASATRWDVTAAGKALAARLAATEAEPKPTVEPSSKWVCWPTRRRA
jgi:biotin operon repressor